ncbi:uncharacterized protein DNG_00764 [Cephalotrichum gorgonifer]|uniref:Uncharacterized protein n=1 Tax=Cephalotrichum gorgonifer TaxID=2041049 RepID=A0AAE8MPV6_9PEZI|nr:uncharacterized protein DNG_00764 [Cephalotrichum gorgonifer]
MPTDPITWFAVAGQRVVSNLTETFDSITLHKAIRLVLIVGGYLLLRPYLMKLTGANQLAQHEKEARESAERAALQPNDLRGGLRVAAEVPDADEDIEGESGPTDWGSKARKRQRQVLRKLIDAEEQRLAEAQGDEDDKDIEEFLLD